MHRVTCASKRRQQASRPEAKAEAIEPRNHLNGKADAVVRAESNITRFVKARNVWLPGVVEPSMFDNVMMHQLGRPYRSSVMEYGRQVIIKQEGQMAKVRSRITE